jgi:hypothetical protein
VEIVITMAVVIGVEFAAMIGGAVAGEEVEGVEGDMYTLLADMMMYPEVLLLFPVRLQGVSARGKGVTRLGTCLKQHLEYAVLNRTLFFSQLKLFILLFFLLLLNQRYL